MSGPGDGDLGRDPDVGEAVVEEAHVVEHVLERLGRRRRRRAAGRDRPTAPRTVARVWRSCVPSVVRVGSVCGRRSSSSGQRLAMLSRTSSKCRSRASTTASASRRSMAAEDRRVEVGRPLRVGAGNDQGDVGPRERLERAPHPFERAVVGEFDDPPVEAGVGLGHARGRRRRGPPPAWPRGSRRAPRRRRRSSAGRPAGRRAPRAPSGPRTPR